MGASDMQRSAVHIPEKTMAHDILPQLLLTQQELAYLVGLSRQRVNMALQRLVAEGWISVAYGGVRVLNLPALRSHTLGAP